MRSIVPLLVLLLIFVVPLAGIVVFVQWRAKNRREKLRGPWTALAHKLGGQFSEGSGFTGSSIYAQRPTHALSVKMTLVSVMQAASVPYYPDGGTYTEIIVQLHPQHPACFIPPGAGVQTFVDHTRIPTLANLGPHAKIYMEPKTARVVLPGAIDSFPYLDAAAQSLEHLTHMVVQMGPLPAAR